MQKKDMTLALVVKDGRILLAEKLRGHGKGLLNGAGGKVEPGETIEKAMIRETQEELGITPIKYEICAINTFEILYKDEMSIIDVHTFIARDYTGELQESDEMRPVWFDLDEIPYSRMWPDDTIWLPKVLSGEKIKGHFIFDKDNNLISANTTPLC